MVHCPDNAAAAKAEVGSFIVGSTRGLWATASHSHVTRFLEDSLAQYHPSHVESKRKEGLVLARRVTSSSRMLDDCYHLATEPVLTLELFTKMRIESYLEQPFRHFALPRNPSPNPEPESSQEPDPSLESDQTQSKRELLTESTYAPPRSGSLVTSCNANEWSKYDDDFTAPATWFTSAKKVHNSLHYSGRYSFSGSSNNYQYELSALLGGCVEYSADNSIPGTSFLFNYNTVRYILFLNMLIIQFSSPHISCSLLVTFRQPVVPHQPLISRGPIPLGPYLVSGDDRF